MLANKNKIGTAIAEAIGKGAETKTTGKTPGELKWGLQVTNCTQFTGSHQYKKEGIMDKRNCGINTWDRIMMAITFAEAGEQGTARELLAENQNEQRPESRDKKSLPRPEIRA